MKLGINGYDRFSLKGSFFLLFKPVHTVLPILQTTANRRVYLQMSSESVKVEELAGLIAIAAGLHLTTKQDITTQQADLGPHVYPIHLLSHVDKLGFTCINRTHAQ